MKTETTTARPITAAEEKANPGLTERTARYWELKRLAGLGKKIPKK